MDEIATEERLRWSKQENKIYGFCYQHVHCHNTDFTDINSIANLQNLLDTEVHKTKEDLVIAIGNCGAGGHVTPLLSLPSCCKEETNQFSVMINAICNQTKVDVFVTDGDATRIRVFCGMIKPIRDKEINAVMKRMPLFDLTLVNGEKALYLDDKHNGKRMRTIIISDTRVCKINGTVISRDQANLCV